MVNGSHFFAYDLGTSSALHVLANGTTAIEPRGNSFPQYKQTHLFTGISRTRITQRGLLFFHISVKGNVPSDGFLSVLELYFLTLLCCCPFRPTPAKPLELQNLFPLRRLGFTCSRNSFRKLSRSATATLCERMHMHTQNLGNYTSTCFSPT